MSLFLHCSSQILFRRRPGDVPPDVLDVEPLTIRTSNLSLEKIAKICSDNNRIFKELGLNTYVRVVNRNTETGEKTKVFVNGTAVFVVSSKNAASCLKGAFKEERPLTLYERLPSGELKQNPQSFILLKNKDFFNDRSLNYQDQPSIKREFEALTRYAGATGIVSVIGYFAHKGKCNGQETGRIRESIIMPKHLENLSDRIKRGGIKFEEAEAMIFQLIKGIACLHAKGDVHRDLKPANILLGSNQEVFIADFGSCFLTEDVANGVELKLEGSPYYLSPECVDCLYDIADIKVQSKDSQNDCKEAVQGLWAKAIRPSNDIWALGICAYEMLKSTSRKPFLPHLMELLRPSGTNSPHLFFEYMRSLKGKELFQEPIDLYGWEHLVWDMLRVDPDKRITAAELLKKLRLNPHKEEASKEWDMCV